MVNHGMELVHVCLDPKRVKFIKQNHAYVLLYKSDKQNAYVYQHVCV